MSSLMGLRVDGESIDSGFLPEGNYMMINDEAYPLGTFPLKVPEGSCQIDIYSPAREALLRLDYVFKDTEMLQLDIKVNRSRNVVEAKFSALALKDIPPERLGDIADFLKIADDCRPEVDEWKRNNKPTPPQPASKPSSPSTSASRPGGGKAIGWGLVIMLVCILGIVLCYTGEIEIETTAITEDFSLSNLAAYYGGAVIGLITFISGLLIRKADS